MREIKWSWGTICTSTWYAVPCSSFASKSKYAIFSSRKSGKFSLCSIVTSVISGYSVCFSTALMKRTNRFSDFPGSPSKCLKMASFTTRTGREKPFSNWHISRTASSDVFAREPSECVESWGYSFAMFLYPYSMVPVWGYLPPSIILSGIHPNRQATLQSVRLPSGGRGFMGVRIMVSLAGILCCITPCLGGKNQKMEEYRIGYSSFQRSPFSTYGSVRIKTFDRTHPQRSLFSLGGKNSA